MPSLAILGPSLWVFVLAVAGAAPSDPAPTASGAAVAEPAPVAVPPAPAPPPPPVPAPLPPPPPLVRPVSPFRLALTYTHIFRQDGDLIDGAPATNALGIDMVFPSTSYGRSRLGLSHQWEKTRTSSARGFRVDLISVGYPITLIGGRDRLILEPVLTVLRTELMFQDGSSNKLLRLESGFGLELSATIRHWLIAIQPFSVDFRYWVYGNVEPKSRTGLGRILPFKMAVGYEF